MLVRQVVVEQDLLTLDKVLYVRMLVDVTIVHHKHRIRCREGLHMVQGAFNEFEKSACIKSSLYDVAEKDSLFER